LTTGFQRTRKLEAQQGFTRRPVANVPATQAKNYITPNGLNRLIDEHWFLLTKDRPAVVEVVAWAAATMIAVKTQTTSTVSGGCGRLMGVFAFSPSELKPRKWWPRKLRDQGW
jgi:hypothetical protein